MKPKRTGLSSNRIRLRSRRPKNPGHWKIATRDWGGKTAEKLPNSGFSRSERRYSSRQCPGIAGLSAETAISLEFRECLADEPVAREPVSARNSLLTGKFAGNFGKSGPPKPWFRTTLCSRIKRLMGQFLCGQAGNISSLSREVFPPCRELLGEEKRCKSSARLSVHRPCSWLFEIPNILAAALSDRRSREPDFCGIPTLHQLTPSLAARLRAYLVARGCNGHSTGRDALSVSTRLSGVSQGCSMMSLPEAEEFSMVFGRGADLDCDAESRIRRRP